MNRETTHPPTRTGRRRRSLLAAFALAATTVAVQPLTSAGPGAVAASPASSDTLADFEGPAAPAGFFVYNGASSVAATPVDVGDADPLALPGQSGDNGILDVTYDVTDFGGFGQDVNVAFGGPQDWSTYESFDFWFHGTGSGRAYQAEISDNRSNPATDTSERFDYTFTDTTAGWQYISIPLADFTRATDFQPGGAPDDGFTLTEIWAWAIVLPLGADNVSFDEVGLGLDVVDDFESGLPAGVDADGINVGFHTFQGSNSSVSIATAAAPPAPNPPGALPDNDVLQVDLDVTSFAGFIHSFENETVDTWVTQDWSVYSGFAVWMHGTGSGINAFIDVLGARNPGSTTDDAQRWRVDVVDDVAGWRYLQIPFSDLRYFGVGNGAPGAGDGLDLTQIHGWAFGTLGTGGPVTYYFDDLALFGVAEIPELAVSFASNDFEIAEGATGPITVKLNRAMNEDDPAQVSVDYSVETIVPVEGRDFLPVAPGTLTFVNGGPTEQTFDIVTLDDSKYEPTERLILRLSNPVDVPIGGTPQASASIIDDDPYDPLLLDDFEGDPSLWDAEGGVVLDTLEIAAGDPIAVPGQGDFENVLAATVPLAVDIEVEGRVCNQGNGVIPVVLYSTDDVDATTVDHTTVRLGAAGEFHVDKKTGVAKRHEEDVDRDGDIDLVFHFRFADTGLPCDPDVIPFTGATFDGRSVTTGDPTFGRDFAIGQDWTDAEAMSFWYLGQGTGDEVTVELLDNRAPDPGPAGWSLVWSDEFDDPAGTPPNPDNWGYEVGDGTRNGIPGWGNAELQYYTDSPDNAATDGNGNLVITAREADGEQCYYGDCEYTSARLVTTNRAEFAYGRIESRILVPSGEDGLWPAFWSLGTDIDLVEWPQTGEIDIMEYVSRIPDEICGTIHGPGYSGGNAYGNTYAIPNVASDYHTFAIEWQPDLIEWYVDGILYHTATPADVAPNEWVFNDPVYLLLNLALGGNFGGPLDEDLTFPQSMKVDYVRVYQGPDTAERFEASFVDDFTGWQQVVLPFDWFSRSAEQPAGAPDDGLTLSDVRGYGVDVSGAGSGAGTIWLDQVRLVPVPPPTEITVTNLNNGGDGSLRAALADIADVGGTITFDPALAGGTLALTSGPLVVGKSVTIDAVDAPGIVVDGGGVDRVLIVNAGGAVTARHLTLSNGYGFQLAGCVLNNGSLTLDHATVTGCTMTTDAGDFWQGGAGIYSGGGATLNLVDSTVSDNHAGWSGGGVYSFFDTTTNVVRSTISGNVSNDVGGGLRLLGNGQIVNSTISGNTSTGWYGGALFMTDGVVDMTNTTVTGNVSPSYAPAAVFVGTFGPGSATLNVGDSIIAANVTEGCFLAPFGAGAVAINSLGNNVFDDGTCFPVGSDVIVAPGAAGIGALADNGGPTLTHALLPGSPAIDAADPGACPATDQRGVARPQGAGCDVGSFEFVP